MVILCPLVAMVGLRNRSLCIMQLDALNRQQFLSLKYFLTHIVQIVKFVEHCCFIFLIRIDFVSF